MIARLAGVREIEGHFGDGAGLRLRYAYEDRRSVQAGR